MFDTEKLLCEIEARPPLYDVKSKAYSNREEKAKCWFEIGKAMWEDWNEIDLGIKDDRVKDLMKKWKAIRDAFVKDYKLVTAPGTGKAASSKKRYLYYDQLLFLLPYVKGNPNTSSNIEPPTTQNEEETVELNTSDIATPEQQQAVVNDSKVSSVPSTSVAKKRKLSPTKKFESRSVLAGKRTALERSVASSTKDLTNLLAQSLEMQKEEKNSDQFGHRVFTTSFASVLNNMPFNTAMLLRGHISEIFSTNFQQLHHYQINRSHSSMSTSTPPLTPLSVNNTNDLGDANDNFNISDYINI